MWLPPVITIDVTLVIKLYGKNEGIMHILSKVLNQFELIKKIIILGKPDLTRWALYKRIQGHL